MKARTFVLAVCALVSLAACGEERLVVSKTTPSPLPPDPSIMAVLRELSGPATIQQAGGTRAIHRGEGFEADDVLALDAVSSAVVELPGGSTVRIQALDQRGTLGLRERSTLQFTRASRPVLDISLVGRATVTVAAGTRAVVLCRAVLRAAGPAVFSVVSTPYDPRTTVRVTAGTVTATPSGQGAPVVLGPGQQASIPPGGP